MFDHLIAVGKFKLIYKFFIIFFVITTSSCTSVNNREKVSVLPSKRILVLLHGLYVDSTVWNSVKSELENRGISVIAPNIDYSGQNELDSISRIAEKLCLLIPRNSILIAHSFSGSLALQTLEICAFKVLKVVFVSSTIPLPGSNSMTSATSNDQSLIKKIVINRNGVLTPIDKDKFFQFFDSNLTSDKTKNLKIYSTTFKIVSEVSNYSQEILLRVPKVYILTTNDRLMPEDIQIEQAKHANIDQIIKINTGHMPMLTAPAEFSTMILNLIN